MLKDDAENKVMRAFEGEKLILVNNISWNAYILEYDISHWINVIWNIGKLYKILPHILIDSM